MLNKLKNFIDTHPIGQIFQLGQNKAVWKKVTELKAGMKIATEKNGRLEWDEIVSIKNVGRERVYDIEVEGTHNFVGNGIIAHNTNLSLTDTGDVILSGDLTDGYTVTTPTGITSRIGAFAQLIVANIKAGTIVTKEFTTDSFTALQGQIDKLIAGNIKTKLISPLADSTDVTVMIGSEATPSGKFAIQNSLGTEVAAIDSNGNARLQGDLTARQATFSGTLFADNIKSQSLDDIQALLTKVETDQKLLAEAAAWNTSTATDSAKLDELVLSDLYVTGQAAINSLSVTNSLAIGTDFVINANDSSLNSLSAPLRIQSLALAPVEIMAGLVTIDTQGNVKIAGNLYVAGEITTQTGFKVQDSGFNDIASIDASGSAEFNNLATDQLIIASSEATESAQVIPGDIETNSTIGRGIIPAGTDSITITNPRVGNYTLVYTTPTSSTQNKVLYVKAKDTGWFRVGFTEPLDTDVEFNWWIVQIQ